MFRPYISRYKWWIIAACASVVVTDLVALVPPWITGEAVGVLEDSLKGGYFSNRPDALTQIMLLTVLFLSSGLLLAMFRFLWRRLAFDTSRFIEFDLRDELFAHLLRLTPKYYDNAKVGDLISRASYDIEMIRMFLSVGLIIVVDVAAIEIVTIPLLMYINWELTLLLIVPLPFLGIIATRLIRRLHKVSRIVQDQTADLSAQVQELYSGARVIKAYSREDAAQERFRVFSQDNVKVNMDLAWARSWFHTLVMSAAVVVQLIFLWFGGSQVISGELPLKDFVKFNFYMMWIVFPMAYLGWGINLFQRGLASMERLREVTDTPPDIMDGPDVDLSIDKLRGNIEFRNLSFAYEDKTVLSNISFSVEQGKTVAIVGRTGCGKSTLVHLLARLYNPPRGAIFVDGHDVRRIPLEKLRGCIGFVTQEPLLFSETIAENIAFGMSSFTEEDVRKAAEMAGVAEEIDGFPKKYQTLLGERGVNISGGQKQRTTIARALAVDPAILVLDDALSSVDTKTEEKILESLRDVRKGRTCIIISHRISSVKDADNIIVLEGGRIAEMGSHEELLKKHGYYHDLHRRQELTRELEEA